MSDNQRSFFGDGSQLNPTDMDTIPPEVEYNGEDVITEEEMKGSFHLIKSKGITYTNSEYANMKGDPLMSHVYSTERPAAGHPSSIFPHIPNNTQASPTSRRHYQMASDIFGHGQTMFMPDPAPLNLSPRHHVKHLDGTSYSSSEYANMKGDPTMSHEYSSGRAAAGYHAPRSTEGSPASSRRHCKTACDTFDVRMDKSENSSSRPGSREGMRDTAQLNMSPRHNSDRFEYPTGRNATRSFKITEVASNEDLECVQTGGGASEPDGNPGTGQGFDEKTLKTGKRHFGGGNASQQLW